MAGTSIKVSVNREQLAHLRDVLTTLRAPKQGVFVSKFLLKAGYAVLADAAKNQIIRGGRFRGPAGPRGGKGKLRDTKPHPTRLTSRTGELRRSLGANGDFNRAVNHTGLPKWLDVGSDLVYARVHELGTNGHPRPFLAPAVAAVSPRFEGMLLAEMDKAVTEAAR
jgi:hypothetical protein